MKPKEKAGPRGGGDRPETEPMPDSMPRIDALQRAGVEAAAETADLTADAEPASWPDPPAAAAYYGLPGCVVRAIEPHTEADPVALLIQFLAAFGNAIGRGARFRVEADRHYTNLFAVLVGETSMGRKGTSARRVLAFFGDEYESANVAHGGLSSGEGLLWAVRDPITKREPIREGKGRDRRVVDYEEVQIDPGVDDKRLLVVESEFAGVLAAMSRQGNTLSPVLRRAWDGADVLRTMTKNSPAKATGAHISIIGHVTKDELLRYLDDTELLNGFGNRFLWACVRRSKCLPDGGGAVPDCGRLADEISAALEFGRAVGEVRRDNAARELWHAVYPRLTDGRGGLFGAAIARAAPQVVRLAMLYALADRSDIITRPHLEAGLALWDFCERSARYVFGDALGDPVADSILDGLRRAPDGLTRDQIRDLFGRHRRSGEIDRALGVLAKAGRAVCRNEETGGRPREVWTATPLSAHTALSAHPLVLVPADPRTDFSTSTDCAISAESAERGAPVDGPILFSTSTDCAISAESAESPPGAPVSGSGEPADYPPDDVEYECSIDPPDDDAAAALAPPNDGDWGVV